MGCMANSTKSEVMQNKPEMAIAIHCVAFSSVWRTKQACCDIYAQ